MDYFDIIYNNKSLSYVKKHRVSSNYRIQATPKFIFLCGRQKMNPTDTTNRDLVKEYFKSNKDVFCIFAEKLWIDDSKKALDLLSFEDLIAELSDAIILFIESPGTICELGAFAFAEKHLLEKLIIVADKNRKDDPSFINLGPIRKARENLVPVIYTNISTPLTSKEFTSELANILQKKKRIINTTSMVFLSTFVIEILEIISLFDPIKRIEIVNLYKKLKGIDGFNLYKADKKPLNNISVSTIIDVLLAAEIIISNNEYINLNNDLCFDINLMYNIDRTDYNRIRSMIYSKKLKYNYGT
jgi:hypothetical protein